MTRVNEWDQPVGDPVAPVSVRPLAPLLIEGRWVRLEPLDPAHGDELFDATCGEQRARLWTYLYDEMPQSREDGRRYVTERAARSAQHAFAVRPSGHGAAGIVSWVRDDPANGSVEVGGIVLGPELQRSTAATEAMWLMARHVFDAGYRRYEWKCDALNAPSRTAAARLGFGYEGTFRQAVVYKGRNRDTAWYAMTDGDWQRLAAAYAAWLEPDNFDNPVTGSGQRTSLSRLTAEALRRPA